MSTDYHGPRPGPELLIRFAEFCCLWPRFIMNSWNDDAVTTTPWMYPEALPAERHAMRRRDYWTVIRDEANQPLRVQGLTMDITPEYEMARLSSQGERVEAMHDLAGRIVHDSNNLLMILSGYGEELLHGLPSDNPLRGHGSFGK